ncbi:MAG: GNAT family N-acetyltransferase [Bacteroidetes bacterium RIFCSPLOWO2_12_FULL_35_15]|nr:MAG: GNAT family N-acetyltransferase [Bacteroidetes bacterium RIFCSPLOWO2_12_FULL_35_15]
MTTHIKLRPWTSNDIETLAKFANNINIAKNLTNKFPSPYTIEDARIFIESFNTEFPVKVMAIEVNNEAVGSIGIFPQEDIACKNAELGYLLSEEYWGKGIMPEAIIQMVEYGFKTFDITRIFARPFGPNIASQRVLEKAGFTLEARFEKTFFKNGEYLDELIYAIRQ